MQVDSGGDQLALAVEQADLGLLPGGLVDEHVHVGVEARLIALEAVLEAPAGEGLLLVEQGDDLTLGQLPLPGVLDLVDRGAGGLLEGAQGGVLGGSEEPSWDVERILMQMTFIFN